MAHCLQMRRQSWLFSALRLDPVQGLAERPHHRGSGVMVQHPTPGEHWMQAEPVKRLMTLTWKGYAAPGWLGIMGILLARSQGGDAKGRWILILTIGTLTVPPCSIAWTCLARCSEHRH
mmetsp:Transcript_51779/g.121157  ORF Transcript_51779/g.121157 Transcript_51779/m.121157 type:complete len:119 (-) Transcript_51779:39-395(-)